LQLVIAIVVFNSIFEKKIFFEKCETNYVKKLYLEAFRHDFDNPAIYGLVPLNSFFRVNHRRIRQVLDWDETGYAIVHPDLDSDSFARTSTGIKMIPDLSQFWKVILTTKWALPSVSFT
jgi:hypothetical protein